MTLHTQFCACLHFQFADTTNNSTSSENSQRIASTAATDDPVLPNVNQDEQNNNIPDAVNANLYPKVAVSALIQTSKSASVASVASEDDKELSSVLSVRNATSPASYSLVLTALEPVSAVSGIAKKSVTDDSATTASESADKTCEVCNCVWMQ